MNKRYIFGILVAILIVGGIVGLNAVGATSEETTVKQIDENQINENSQQIDDNEFSTDNRIMNVPGKMKEDPILANANSMLMEGRQIFRFDTFGDEAFWGDTLKIHQAIAGAANGGVGSGVSPKTALAVGLKVDVDALPGNLIKDLEKGKVDLDDPATTLALLKLNAVVGVKGSFDNNGKLNTVGITCAICHSTVDDSFAPGIGHRLDGWANHDLNVGAIVNLSPDLTPVADLLGVPEPTVRTVLNSWGPGKFDAELFLDGKAFNPQQVTDGVVTGTNVSGATLIPDAFGLAGYNQHTWTGAWGSVPYWNAFVANLEMHGKGVFYDPRLNDTARFPIAAANGFGNVRTDPDDDLITSKLPALQFYQLAIPSPVPEPGVDFDKEAAERGDELFSTKAQCNNCHVEPLWTEPGWNLHKPSEIGIDSFQADRAPDGVYKTMNLAGIFVRERGLFMKPENKGRFYHDGRFKTLLDVVDHYNTFFNLNLTAQEKGDLVEYVKSLSAGTVSTSNIIKNPGFEFGTASWIFYTNGTGTFTTGPPASEGSNSANIVLNSVGTNIQLYQKGISLEPNTRYRLSFSAYSTSGHDLSVNLIKHGSPYTNYGLSYRANLGTSWQSFTTEFDTTGFTGVVTDGRLMFWLAPFAKAGDKYYIDNVRLEKI